MIPGLTIVRDPGGESFLIAQGCNDDGYPVWHQLARFESEDAVRRFRQIVEPLAELAARYEVLA